MTYEQLIESLSQHPTIEIFERGNYNQEEKSGSFQFKISKSAQLISSYDIPLFCPECGSIMNTDADKMSYILHGYCHRCEAERETQLRIENPQEIKNRGKERYIKNVKYYIDSVYSEMKEFLEQKKRRNVEQVIVNTSGDYIEKTDNLPMEFYEETLRNKFNEMLNFFKDEFSKYYEDDLSKYIDFPQI